MNISRGRCLLPDLLKQREWTQTFFAERSGRSVRMISHFCNGKRAMLPEDMYVASMILECRMEDLYEWIHEK
ncbi:hypothetical protein D3C74_229260 [compost metagenome]